MEIILREDVAGLGIIGDVVRVKPGYARNFLLPRGLAVAADRRNLKELAHQTRIIDAKKVRERGGWEQRAVALDGAALVTEARAGKEGRLFGSVTTADLVALLKDKGHEVDRRQVLLKEPIKRIGTYQLEVRVGQDICAAISVEVRAAAGSEPTEPDTETEAEQSEAAADTETEAEQSEPVADTESGAEPTEADPDK